MPATVDVCSVEGGYRADGHVDREVFVGCLLEEYNKVATFDHVLHLYERFIPIRGEPSGTVDGWFDESRHGYWMYARRGRGAHAYTWIEDYNCG